MKIGSKIKTTQDIDYGFTIIKQEEHILPAGSNGTIVDVFGNNGEKFQVKINGVEKLYIIPKSMMEIKKEDK